MDLSRKSFYLGFQWVESNQGSKLASGEDGVPSPPEATFVMVEIGWLHGAPRTNSHRKWMMDRTKNYKLILTNCLT
jgi:hypothetical protein